MKGSSSADGTCIVGPTPSIIQQAARAHEGAVLAGCCIGTMLVSIRHRLVDSPLAGPGEGMYDADLETRMMCAARLPGARGVLPGIPVFGDRIIAPFPI